MLVIGLDVGTTGTKALLSDDKGRILRKGYQGYKLICDGAHVQQCADDWWTASISAIREALQGYNPKDVAAMSLSTQGATMVALDALNRPVGNAVTWMDTSAVKQAEYIENMLSGEYIYHTTGWRISPSLDAAKILSMKQNPIYRQATSFLSTLEYVNQKLTGNAVIDPTNAAIRQIYNVEAGTWDSGILGVIDCRPSELPEIMPTGTLVGTLCKTAADELGLPADTRVFNGAHDQYCASLGSGAVRAGDMLISTGTTWVVMGVTQKPLFTSSYIASCPHPVTGTYGAMASLAGAGASFQWIRDSFMPDASYDEITQHFSKRQKKNNGLFFIPWLSGAGYPFWNPRANGGFLGMNFSTDKYDMALSVMESAAFNAKSAMIDFMSNGCPITSVKVMGGAARSDVWMDILQTVTDVPIVRMKEPDTCALGAAIIAACAMGWYKDYADAANVMVKSEKIGEGTFNRSLYKEKYPQYCRLLGNAKQFYTENK